MKKILIILNILMAMPASASSTQADIYNYIKESSGFDNRKYAISLQFAYLYFQECKKYQTSDISRFQSSKAFSRLYQDHSSPYINVTHVQNAINETKYKIICSGE